MYIEDGKIEIEAMTYIRGRSISNAYMIIDEAQQLTRHEIKTILTRVGENTIIVFIPSKSNVLIVKFIVILYNGSGIYVVKSKFNRNGSPKIPHMDDEKEYGASGREKSDASGIRKYCGYLKQSPLS